MMFFDGYIGAPPTLTVVSADAEIKAAGDVNANVAKAAAANKLRRLDIVFSSIGWNRWRRHLCGQDDRDGGPRSLAADRSHLVVAQSYGVLAQWFRLARRLTPS